MCVFSSQRFYEHSTKSETFYWFYALTWSESNAARLVNERLIEYRAGSTKSITGLRRTIETAKTFPLKCVKWSHTHFKEEFLKFVKSQLLQLNAQFLVWEMLRTEVDKLRPIPVCHAAKSPLFDWLIHVCDRQRCCISALAYLQFYSNSIHCLPRILLFLSSDNPRKAPDNFLQMKCFLWPPS